MISIKPRDKLPQVLALMIALQTLPPAFAEDAFFTGHIKYQFTNTYYSSDSLFASFDAENTTDHSADMRLIAKHKWLRWDAEMHYQMFGVYGDTFRVSRDLPVLLIPTNAVQFDDRRRLFDLTSVIDDGSQYVFGHRLDRASIGYSGDKLVVRAGRHIVSWGNGLVFTPMDVFNPFDPTAIDKDYKTGDDMLYGQWLVTGGDDLQAIVVPRRDINDGSVHSDQSSLAVKFHTVRGSRDFDLLAARHYDDTVFGGGTAVDWRGAVVRGDVTVTSGGGELTPAGVASISYAWTWWQRNVTGFVEYYYNGFGQRNGNYAIAALMQNEPLLARIARGELFNLGRNYLAASITVEATPLWLVTPVVFLNLDDGSALVQLVMNYDLKQDLRLLAGFTAPLGPNNTEFGGIATDSDGAGAYLGPGKALFAKLAFFF